MIATPIESSVVARGVRFHTAEQGQGPLVLLLHGFPERWYSFRHQLAALGAAGYRAVAPDLRGYGESDRPPRGYDIETLAGDVPALIEALGADRAAVVGHDWGGALTWEAASRYPRQVARYAVLNAPHPAVFLRTLLRSPAQLRRSWYMFLFQLPLLPEWLLTRRGARAIPAAFLKASVDRDALDAETLEGFRTSALSPGAMGAMLAYYRGIGRQLRRPLDTARKMSTYQPIEQPGLLLWGEDDPALGTELIEPHRRLAPALRVERVPRCGHFIQQERPALVSERLLAFLRQTEGAAAARP